MDTPASAHLVVCRLTFRFFACASPFLVKEVHCSNCIRKLTIPPHHCLCVADQWSFLMQEKQGETDHGAHPDTQAASVAYLLCAGLCADMGLLDPTGHLIPNPFLCGRIKENVCGRE